jgi:ribulose-5-phosphate 4-epimerase/fuculose-1-phosphate aldolase
MEIILLTLHINSLLISNPDSPSSDTTLHSQGYIKNGQLVCILHIFPDDNFCGTSIEATLLMYMFASTYSYTSNFQATIY